MKEPTDQDTIIENPNPLVVSSAIDISEKALEQQFQSIDTIESRANFLLGVISILIGIIVIGNPFSEWNLVSFMQLISLLSLIVTLLISLSALKPEEYDIPFRPNKLWKYLEMKDMDFQFQYLVQIEDSFENNGKILNKKWNILYKAQLMLFISVVIIIVTLLFKIWW